MAIELPLKVDGWPAIRILTKPTWGGGAAWTDQPMVQMAPRPVTRLGFEFLRCKRTTIDSDGTAVFRFVYGEMDGQQYPAAPDLGRYEVRILAQDQDEEWHTIWWGTVEQQFDVDMAPGSDHAYGSREYHCLDGVAGRMRHWLLDRHGVYISGGVQRPAAGSRSALPCLGHPGFNSMRWDGRITGTKESSSVVYDPWGDLTGHTLYGRAFYHTFPGNGKLFTDKEAIETAFAEARPAGEVPFYLYGVTEFLSCYSVWPVERGMTLLEFLRRVLRRQRGRGVAFCDWVESGDPISGTFTPRITLMSPFLESLVYTPKGIDPNTGVAYTEVSLTGATEDSNAINVDLIGDHRLGMSAPATFELGDRVAYAVQFLETQGEPIEVAITGAFNDSTPTVERRWETSEADAFENATTDERMRIRYQWVYQLFGLARDWGGKAWDGNAGSGTSQMTRADFRCSDDGELVVPSSSEIGDTSPLLVEVMRDLPLYAEYNYVQNYPSPRYDSLTEDPYPPSRRAPLLLLRVSTTGGGQFTQLAPTPAEFPALYQTTFTISDFGISVFVPGDTATGIRTISDTDKPALGASVSYTDLVFTLGLRLPHRVRFASAIDDPNGAPYTRENAPRRKTITVPHHHLWLAHVSAIWELDATTFSGGTGGYDPKRGPANGSDTVPGIIRDDRGALQQIHLLSWNWYGSDHRTASWQLACCGLLPEFTSGVDGDERTAFPQMGQLVETMSAAGADIDLLTPITVIDYDHTKCLTRWATDWCDRDVQ